MFVPRVNDMVREQNVLEPLAAKPHSVVREEWAGVAGRLKDTGSEHTRAQQNSVSKWWLQTQCIASKT